MTRGAQDHQVLRVVLVTVASGAAFLALALLIYWLYFSNRGAVYDRRLDEGLALLQVLFYSALVVHTACSIATAYGFAKFLRAPRYATLVAVGVTFVLLEALVLLWMSSFHVCNTTASFPIPGLSCDD